MLVRIDFKSDVALYIQLRDQIIMGIATETIKNGESLPSVRQMAEEIGINMHTVNKTYALLREEGFITLDRRNGAVVKLDVDKIKAVKCLKEDMKVVLAKAIAKNISKEEALEVVNEIYTEYGDL